MNAKEHWACANMNAKERWAMAVWHTLVLAVLVWQVPEEKWITIGYGVLTFALVYVNIKQDQLDQALEDDVETIIRSGRGPALKQEISINIQACEDYLENIPDNLRVKRRLKIHRHQLEVVNKVEKRIKKDV